MAALDAQIAVLVAARAAMAQAPATGAAASSAKRAMEDAAELGRGRREKVAKKH